MDSPTISYPFGDMDTQSVDFATSIDLVIKNQKTLVEVGQMTGAMTINVTTPELKAGAELIVKLQSDTTARAVTLGTGFTGTSIAGVISKTKYARFMFDGSNFIYMSSQQVD